VPIDFLKEPPVKGQDFYYVRLFSSFARFQLRSPCNHYSSGTLFMTGLTKRLWLYSKISPKQWSTVVVYWFVCCSKIPGICHNMKSPNSQMSLFLAILTLMGARHYKKWSVGSPCLTCHSIMLVVLVGSETSSPQLRLRKSQTVQPRHQHVGSCQFQREVDGRIHGYWVSGSWHIQYNHCWVDLSW
jgi:hypothetical protein